MSVKVDFKILLFILFFFAIKQVEIYLLFLIFAIIHEISHMVIGILVGFEPTNISITPFGAYISFNISIDNYNRKFINGTICTLKKLLVIIAGPLSNIIFIIAFLYLGEFINIAYVNLIIAFFNLIPIYPLDGGRILKQLLTLFFGRRRAKGFTNLISNIILFILVIVGIYISIKIKTYFILLSLVYLVYIRKKENLIYKYQKKMYEIIDEYNRSGRQKTFN